MSNDGAKINRKENDDNARGITVVDDNDGRPTQRQTSGSNGVFYTAIELLQLSMPTHIFAFISNKIKLRQKDEWSEESSTFTSGFVYPLSILLRPVHLGINFTPVLSTDGLTAVSGWYRNKILFDALYLYGLTLALIFLQHYESTSDTHITMH